MPGKESEKAQDLTYQFTTIKTEMLYSYTPYQLLLSLFVFFLLLALWQP